MKKDSDAIDMKVKILYLIDSYGGFEDDIELEDFVEKDNADYHSVKSLEDICEEEFEVTDSIDEENFNHICGSRFYLEILCHGLPCDIDSSHYHWIFVKVGNDWVLSQDYFKGRKKKKVVK